MAFKWLLYGVYVEIIQFFRQGSPGIMPSLLEVAKSNPFSKPIAAAGKEIVQEYHCIT